MTTATATMPKYILFDANIIIELYKLGVWGHLISRVEVIVPATVARDEAFFYSNTEGGIPSPINLPELIKTGAIKEAIATVEEMAALENVFDTVFIKGLDAGEAEAIALLYSGSIGEPKFCTADKAAIQALAMISRRDLCISMELILRDCGLQQNVDSQFKEAFLKQWLDKGSQNLITGFGLNPKKLLF
ncbi:MAG: hypothetical protein FJ119_07755 [Deltaproteobacteria bacterium]|nr:hypothetical protein [Deltaproteobacteria bacterium]